MHWKPFIFGAGSVLDLGGVAHNGFRIRVQVSRPPDIELIGGDFCRVIAEVRTKSKQASETPTVLMDPIASAPRGVR